jgi:AcrR family transcriptional regulator
LENGVTAIRPGVFFAPRTELPRGRHALDRETVRAEQRERLMAAYTELVAHHGYASVTVTSVVAHAAVSREAFYAAFDDLAGCADAAYERFIAVLLGELALAIGRATDWHALVEAAIRAYLETLQADPVVARAMQVEMDAAGKPARVRRRTALKQMADVLAARHAEVRRGDPSLGPLPDEAFLGYVYAMRQLASDLLEDDPEPDLLALIEPTVRWVAAGVNGAARTEGSLRTK